MRTLVVRATISPMTGSTIAKQFGTYIDDTSELSDEEIYLLMNKIFGMIYMQPLRVYKKIASLTMSAGQATLPTDFLYLPTGTQFRTSGGKMHLLTLEEVIDNKSGLYIDGTLLKSTSATQDGTIKFVYQKKPADITANTSPEMLPDTLTYAIVHGMCSDDFMIQQFEKPRSYRDEQNALYLDYLSKILIWDSKFTKNIYL